MADVDATTAAPPASPLAVFLRALRVNKGSAIGLSIVVLLVVAAIVAPLIAPHDPLEQDVLDRLKPPSADHWLGTDYFGRDTFSRLLYGARVSLVIAVSATLIAMAIGSAIGIAGGGGRGTFW